MTPLADILGFMAEPWFGAAWYAIAIAGVVWVIYDVENANSALNPPLKVAWPIIIFFFSIIGIALYLATSRPSDIGDYHGRLEKMKRFTEYSQPRWRKVIASATHCVGGDGLGIMTAMALSRVWGLTFWQEFWFEYAAGYLFGWFIFQLWAMRLHGNGWLMSIWKVGRAEFFSMITVMIGMGLVMRFVTPNVVGDRPLPDTFAFWTFGALGLLVGFIATYPMNWWLVAIGWKHGQGHEHMLEKMDSDRSAEPERRRGRGRGDALAARQA